MSWVSCNARCVPDSSTRMSSGIPPMFGARMRPVSDSESSGWVRRSSPSSASRPRLSSNSADLRLPRDLANTRPRISRAPAARIHHLSSRLSSSDGSSVSLVAATGCSEGSGVVAGVSAGAGSGVGVLAGCRRGRAPPLRAAQRAVPPAPARGGLRGRWLLRGGEFRLQIGKLGVAQLEHALGFVELTFELADAILQRVHFSGASGGGARAGCGVTGRHEAQAAAARGTTRGGPGTGQPAHFTARFGRRHGGDLLATRNTQHRSRAQAIHIAFESVRSWRGRWTP